MEEERELQVEASTEDIPSVPDEGPQDEESLKYHLLGPSLTKAGQDSVDQRKVSQVKQSVLPHPIN
jgi:DNA polymerase kappa